MPMHGKPRTDVQVAQSVLRMSRAVCLPVPALQKSTSLSADVLATEVLSADQSRCLTAAQWPEQRRRAA